MISDTLCQKFFENAIEQVQASGSLIIQCENERLAIAYRAKLNKYRATQRNLAAEGKIDYDYTWDDLTLKIAPSQGTVGLGTYDLIATFDESQNFKDALEQALGKSLEEKSALDLILNDED